MSSGYYGSAYSDDPQEAVLRARSFLDQTRSSYADSYNSSSAAAAPITSGFRPSSLGIEGIGGAPAANTEAESALAGAGLAAVGEQALAKQRAEHYRDLAKIQRSAISSSSGGGLFGGILGGVGTVAGGLIGGPVGASIGGAIGGLFG